LLLTAWSRAPSWSRRLRVARLGSTIVQSILAEDYRWCRASCWSRHRSAVVNLVVDVLLALLDPRSTIRES